MRYCEENKDGKGRQALATLHAELCHDMHRQLLAPRLAQCSGGLKKEKEGKENKLDSMLISLEDMVDHLKKIIVRENAISAICHGADLAVQGVSKVDKGIEKDETIAIMSPKGELIALAYSKFTSADINKKKTGIIAKTNKVIMDKDKYPKSWGKK